MKMSELNSMPVEEIRERLKNEREDFSKMKFNHGVAGTENPMRLREKRRNIARMLTVLNSKNSGK